MIQEIVPKIQSPLPVKKYQPPVEPNTNTNENMQLPLDSKIMWLSLGIVIGTVITLISVILVNQFVFKSQKPEVLEIPSNPIITTTPTQTIPTITITPTPITESETKQDLFLYGDFCNGYTAQEANCQLITQTNQLECQNEIKVEKPYCNIVKLENSEITLISELPIKTSGGSGKFSYILGKQDSAKSYFIERIESIDGNSKIFNAIELDLDTKVLNSDIFSFEYKDSCLAIEYDSLGVPLKIGLNPLPEFLSVCPESKLTPEIKGQFAELLNYF